MKQQTPQSLPNSFATSGREAKREECDNRMLNEEWQCAIRDVRGLLLAARSGEDVETNVVAACTILARLRHVVDNRVRYSCSCEGSQSLEQSLSLLNQRLLGARSALLLASAIAKSVWGRNNPLKCQITSALRQVPTLAEIGKLASELGSVRFTDDIPRPLIRHSRQTQCAFCGE